MVSAGAGPHSARLIGGAPIRPAPVPGASVAGDGLPTGLAGRHARAMWRWLGQRSTAEILVLAVTFTVCIGLVVSGVTLLIFEFMHPDADTSTAFQLLAGVINTLIGLIAGFLAGKAGNGKNGTTR